MDVTRLSGSRATASSCARLAVACTLGSSSRTSTTALRDAPHRYVSLRVSAGRPGERIDAFNLPTKGPAEKSRRRVERVDAPRSPIRRSV